MRLTRESNERAGTLSYTVTFRRNELVRAKLFDWDRALIADVEGAEDATVADQLLVLEMFARRIEETDAASKTAA